MGTQVGLGTLHPSVRGCKSSTNSAGMIFREGVRAAEEGKPLSFQLGIPKSQEDSDHMILIGLELAM